MTMPTAAEPSRLNPGDFIGPYRVVEHLAEGEHWDIYLARSGSEQRQVALKILRGRWIDATTLIERADLAKQLKHAHIAAIYAAGIDRECAYVAQELVTDQRGNVTDLRIERLDHGGHLPEERVRVLAKQILEGIACAHTFPGGGVVHGRLDERAVLLNEQRRAKLLDVGLMRDPTGDARAEDLRSAGALFARMLLGEEVDLRNAGADGRGLSRGWTRIIADLLCAEAQDQPDPGDVVERILALDEPRKRRRWLWPAAAAMLLAVALVGGAVAMGTRMRRQRQGEAKAEAEATLQRLDTVQALLAGARQAQARGAFAEAEDFLDQARAVDPQHPEIDRVAADLNTLAGLERIQPHKERAEKAWEAIAELPGGQGFDKLIRDVDAQLTAARNALTNQAFEQAQEHYRRAADEAVDIAKLHDARARASAVRREAAVNRDRADSVKAAEFAAPLWEQGVAADGAAREHAESRRFDAAAEAWAKAAALFLRAESKADGTHRLTSARNAFESALVAAGEDARQAIPQEIRAAMDRAVADAQALTDEETWRDAAQAWDRALVQLREGIREADATLRERHFNEALARGEELAAARQVLAAEQAVKEALAVKGYEDNPKAARLLARVRELQQDLERVPPSRQGNLVRNGDFSVGQGGAPVGWTRPDNLTVFWEDGGVSGKCIRMDTDVYRSEWEEHRKHPEKPITKTPTSGTRYNTVGGTTGVAVYSYPIEVQPGAYYRVSYDVKGQGEPFLYIKGYWKCSAEHLKDMGEKIFFQPVPGGPSFSLVAYGTSGEEKRNARAGDFIQSFRRRVVARFPSGDRGWRRFETVLQLPPDRPIQVVLLELYAFWPPGEYRFDNVRMEQVSRKDFDAYLQRRQELGEKANIGRPVE